MSKNKITCEYLLYDYKRNKYYCSCLALFLGSDWMTTFCESGKCVACSAEDCVVVPCSQVCHVLNDVDIL